MNNINHFSLTTTMIPVLLMLLAALYPRSVCCFVIQPSTQRNNNIVSKRAVISPSGNIPTSTKEASNELLSILIQKANNPKEGDARNEQINALVDTLIKSKSSFNPSTCIDGPLFASIHFIGDTPLWEKIGSGAVRNVKGQKINLNDNTFSNYAEIFGDNLCLIATGELSDVGPVQSAVDDNNPFNSFSSLFASKQSSNLPTPYDYEAKVTGASISFLEKYSLNLSIEGTGIVRVLYADENLRIFVSPTDTNVTKGAEGWESEGLIVVQVRVGLVYDDWVDKL